MVMLWCGYTGIPEIHAAQGAKMECVIQEPDGSDKYGRHRGQLSSAPVTFAVSGEKWSLTTTDETPKGKVIGYQFYDGNYRYAVSDSLWFPEQKPIPALVDERPYPIRGEGASVTLWLVFN